MHIDGFSSNFGSEFQAELDAALEDGLSDEGTIDEDGSSCSSSDSRGRNSNIDGICEINMMSLDAEQELPSIAEGMVTTRYGKSVFELQENIS